MYFMIFLQYSIMILQYSSITIHQKESIDRMSEIKLNNILQKKKKSFSPKSSNNLSRKQIYKWRRPINFHQLVMFSFYSKHRKSLDLVNNWFMFHVLEKFGLVKNFIKRIKILLTNQESCIINGWKAFKYLKLKEGAREGDPISAYLFILVL